MRTVQQTDLHCELTGLNVLRGLSGKPEPGCLDAEADAELLSVTLKSLTISSMTGISESLCNTATRVQLCGMHQYQAHKSVQETRFAPVHSQTHTQNNVG